MSIHIGAKENEIGSKVLLPGDPLRAKFIAENMLENPVCYNEIRGMYGFTGYYKGEKISVQGTGMGIPSISIYANELIEKYNVNTLVRIGTCGALQTHLRLRDIVLAMSASTDSAVNKIRFKNMDFSPIADFGLLNTAYKIAVKSNMDVKVGSVLTTDTFYEDDSDWWALWSKYGTLAVEMETAALYTLAAKLNVRALSILTVSDHIVTNEITTSKERENTFTDMVRLALDTVVL